MHIVLGALGSVVTVLWLLHRLAEMGIDLGGLNPWLWRRRRKWRKKYETNPIFTLDRPLDVAGLLIAATAKVDGDISSEEKKAISSIFESEFHMSKRDAAGMLISSTYLFGKGDEVREKLDAIMAPSLTSFTREQAKSTIGLMRRVAELDGAVSENQTSLINEASSIFQRGMETQRKTGWG